MISWDDNLLQDQKQAASFTGCHSRVLAGPGTGKTLTLTRKAAYLITQKRVSPDRILAITFTRAAAFELRSRISEALGEWTGDLPRVSTLHSFALRQLLRNSWLIDALPQPLRIADDWEERQIILEDLKSILAYDLKEVRNSIEMLSADWQTLDADEETWEERFPDPRFLGAWGEQEKWYEGEHDPVVSIEGKKPFLGPLVVLIGPKTISAAEDFLIPLHASSRATLVGERTAGSTGQPLLLKLPAGASVRICTKRDTYPDGREFVGIGVIPDVEVLPTQADVAAGRYANAKDPVLEKGLEVLKAQIRK